MSEKSRGPEQNLGAYAPGPLGKSNPGFGVDLVKVFVSVSQYRLHVKRCLYA